VTFETKDFGKFDQTSITNTLSTCAAVKASFEHIVQSDDTYKKGIIPLELTISKKQCPVPYQVPIKIDFQIGTGLSQKTVFHKLHLID